MNSKLRRSHTEEWSNKWPVGLAARCQVMFCLYDYPETIHRSDKPWRIYIRHTNCTAPILASTTTTNDYDLSSFPSVCGGRGGGCVRVCVCVCVRREDGKLCIKNAEECRGWGKWGRERGGHTNSRGQERERQRALNCTHQINTMLKKREIRWEHVTLNWTQHDKFWRLSEVGREGWGAWEGERETECFQL